MLAIEGVPPGGKSSLPGAVTGVTVSKARAESPIGGIKSAGFTSSKELDLKVWHDITGYVSGPSTPFERARTPSKGKSINKVVDVTLPDDLKPWSLKLSYKGQKRLEALQKAKEITETSNNRRIAAPKVDHNVDNIAKNSIFTDYSSEITLDLPEKPEFASPVRYSSSSSRPKGNASIKPLSEFEIQQLSRPNSRAKYLQQRNNTSESSKIKLDEKMVEKVYDLQKLLEFYVAEPKVVMHSPKDHVKLLSRVGTPPKERVNERIGDATIAKLNELSDEINNMSLDCKQVTPKIETLKLDYANVTEEQRQMLSHQAKRAKLGSKSNAAVINQLKNYQQGIESFESLSIFAELRFHEVLTTESKIHGTNPSKLKAAAVADLLLKLTKGLGSYSAIIEELVGELLNSVYVDYYRSPVPIKSITNFYHKQTFFEKSEDLAEALDDAQTELHMINQGVEMKSVIKKSVSGAYNTHILFIRDACFFTWKLHTNRNRRLIAFFDKKYLHGYFKRLLQFSVLSRLEKGKSNAWRPGLGISKNLIESYSNSVAVTKKLETKVIQLQDSSDSKKGHFKNIGGGIGGEAYVVSIANKDDRDRGWKQAVSSSRTNGGMDMVRKHQECQTPAEWVTINEIDVERDDASISSGGKKKGKSKGNKKGGKRTNSGKIQGKRSKSGGTGDEDDEDDDAADDDKDSRKRISGSTTVTHRTPGSNIQANKMSVDNANELVALIYETKVRNIVTDPIHLEFSDSLLEFIKDFLNTRYGIKELAVKNLNGLIICCQKNCHKNKRLAMFMDVCGIPNRRDAEINFDPDKCRFFFTFLKLCFESNIKMISATLNSKSKEIDRAIIIDAVKHVFHNTLSKGPEIYKNLQRTIMTMKTVKKEAMNKEIFRVDFDHAMHAIMRFYMFEMALAGNKLKSVMLIQKFVKRWKNNRKLRLEGKLPPLQVRSLYDMASKPKILSTYMAGDDAEDDDDDDENDEDQESLVSNKCLFSVE